MTLETILELARQARRSPHARRVLHDALLERYGDGYAQILDDAGRSAMVFDMPILVMLLPRGLVNAENAWYLAAPATTAPSYTFLRSWAFTFVDPSYRHARQGGDSQHLLTVLPPSRSRRLTER